MSALFSAISDGQDSLKMQARHYKTLSNMYNKPNAKPIHSDVAQVLDLEFKARRAFINADETREEDRPAKIFEAYSCFRDVRNVCLYVFIFYNYLQLNYCLSICVLNVQWLNNCAQCCLGNG